MGTASIVAPEVSAKATLGLDVMAAPEGSQSLMFEFGVPRMGPFAGFQVGIAAGGGIPRPTYVGVMGGVGITANPAASTFDLSWVVIDWTRMANGGR